jgi:hypothetical protein
MRTLAVSDVNDRVEDFIAHYASEFYDPVKAHEYYERNKQLKGRQTTKGMSDVQKQALSYTKKSIGDAKKADLKKAEAARKAQLEAVRASAEAARTRIEAKLKGLLDQLQNKVKVIPKPKPKLKPLNEIPANASEAVKAYLEKQNAHIRQANKKIVDKANADYSAKVQAAQKVASDNSLAARKAASAEIRKIGTDAKAAIAKARANYEASKKQTEAKYKQASDTEYNNIRTQLPSAPPKVKKPRKPTKRRSTQRKENLQNDSQTQQA